MSKKRPQCSVCQLIDEISSALADNCNREYIRSLLTSLAIAHGNDHYELERLLGEHVPATRAIAVDET